MEKGKVNELFRSKFGNQRLRGFIKTGTKLLPSIRALPSLCKCLTKGMKLFLVLPAMHGGFRDEDAEPSAPSVAVYGWTPLPKQEPSAPTYGITTSDFSVSSTINSSLAPEQPSVPKIRFCFSLPARATGRKRPCFQKKSRFFYH